MVRRSSAGVGDVFEERRWLCWAMGVSVVLASCGGRATDGAEPAEGAPTVQEPEAPVLVMPYRETCEDNPLLAGCPQPYDFCRNYPLSSPCAAAPDTDVPDTDAADDDEVLAVAAARSVLVSYCSTCHGSDLTEAQASDSINYIDDWDRLVRVGLVEECAPERSRIITLMRAGEMPPVWSGLPGVTESEIETVEQAIDLDCAAP